RRLSDLQSEHVRVLGRSDTGESDFEGLESEEKRLLDEAGSGVALLDLSGPLIFGAAQTLTRQQNRLDQTRVLVIDLTGVPHLGVSAALILERIMHDAAARGARVIVSGIQEQPRGRLEQLGVAEDVRDDDWVATRADAVRRACGEGDDTPAATGDVAQAAQS
ncbi:MAG: STAS domain-containing protein, partial [Guyparkeria sp.]